MDPSIELGRYRRPFGFACRNCPECLMEEEFYGLSDSDTSSEYDYPQFSTTTPTTPATAASSHRCN